MSDKLLTAENVRLSNELRRTRIQLARHILALVDIEQTVLPLTARDHPVFPEIYNRIQKILKESE